MRNILCFIALAILVVVCAGIPSRNNNSVGKVKRSINPWDFFNKKKDTKKRAKTKPKPTTQAPTTAPVITTATPVVQPTDKLDKNKMPDNIAEALGKLKTKAQLLKFLNITAAMSQRIAPVKKAIGQGSFPSSDWTIDCIPRLKVIRYQQPAIYHGILFPSCGLAYRCGGCCFVDMHRCVPAKVKNETHYAYFVPYDSVSSQSSLTQPKRKLRKKRSVIQERQIIIENHEGCKCQCKVTAKDCNPERQFHKESTCQCKCKDAFTSKVLQCKKPFRYNEETCSCKCAYEHWHCPVVKQKWDNKQCKCVCDIGIKCPKRQAMNENTCECEDITMSLSKFNKKVVKCKNSNTC